MDTLTEVNSRKTVRSWVQFEQRDVEDKAASAREGKYVGRDVDYVIITPAYGKDDVHKTVDVWIQDMKEKANTGKISFEDQAYYLSRYDAWKKGLEMPIDGSPIKGWGVLSPAQQKSLISVGVLTVEDLAAINDEGIRRIGMGGVELRRKANAWLSQLQDKGPLTQKIAAVQSENDTLKIQVNTMQAQMQQLMAQMPKSETPAAPVLEVLDDEPQASGARRPRK